MTEETIRAALSVLGLSTFPKTHDDLRKAYRRHAKLSHPDSARSDDTRPILRVYKAYEVLSEAIDEINTPIICVKFGEGEYSRANVSKIEPAGFEGCNYVVALKWFSGMFLNVNNGTWRDVPEAKSFAIENVWVYFI